MADRCRRSRPGGWCAVLVLVAVVAAVLTLSACRSGATLRRAAAPDPADPDAPTAAFEPAPDPLARPTSPGEAPPSTPPSTPAQGGHEGHGGGHGGHGGEHR